MSSDSLTAERHISPHPITFLRMIDLPRCIICGDFGTMYCGACRTNPTFCKVEHFFEYWPIHSQTCQRDLVLCNGVHVTDPPVYAYTGTLPLTTRTAVSFPAIATGSRLSVSGAMPGGACDNFVNAFVAQHDRESSRFLDINLSPSLLCRCTVTHLQDFFQAPSVPRSFIIDRDVMHQPLNEPLYVVYFLKFASLNDVLHVRDYFSYFA
ncbi:hypothetical protein LXA43DRAFT_1066506 [Ganoderma leucocontextum]|nr:hypothetical protein LXA43DRAFT_1066506 [Ganoderma leucocontextum]